MRILALAILLIILVCVSPTAATGSGTGSVIVQIQGYGTVHGQLQNALIQSNNNVTMSMVVNDQLQTPQGSFPLQATGDWNGALNNSTLSGTIDNVQGKIHVCVISSCNDVDFSGHGTWTGQLQTASSGSGNYTGTITITNSQYPQIPLGQTIPIYGSWASNFASVVPEFNYHIILLLLATLMAATILTHRRRRT
ncbi:MAG: hypothetical protein ABSA50_02400 [Candidatus Bathyarchaeia archaeon]|jgi:hypothetical protein